MLQPSITPLLVAIQLGFLAVLNRRSGGTSPAITVFLLWLFAYALLTSYLGARGLYVDPDLLALMPGLWLQLITVAVAVVPVILFASVRDRLRRMVDRTPLHWFAWFNALRIGALGTAYKTSTGEFPLYFELLVGVPDLLFGLSALWMAWRAKRGLISLRGFMIWNLIGALVIVPSAPILIQLGLPGPLQVFTALPDARAIMTYPMSIAPMFVVPLFVLINLCVAWRLWERLRAAPSKAGSPPD